MAPLEHLLRRIIRSKKFFATLKLRKGARAATSLIDVMRESVTIGAAFASCSSPPTPPPPIRIAHCIAGTLESHRPDYSLPISDPKAWSAWAHWLYAMRLEGFQNGVFIVLDMLRANNTAATTNRATSTRGVEALRREVIQTEGPEADWPTRSDALEAMRIGAEHVELSSFAPGVCQRANASTDFNCTSRCSQLGPASWPRFFEQLGKHAECFRMLNAHEKTQNFRYAWVTKMRSDPNIAVEYWMEPKYLRAAISQLTSATQLDNPTILTSPYIHGRCYSWSDWFVLVPRRLARRYFNMVHELKCDWLQCAASAYTAKRKELSPLSDASEIHDWLIHRDGACLYNERLLVEWLYSGTQRVNVTPASQHILLPNRSSKCWHGRNGTGTGRMEWLEEQASLINGWPGRTTVSKLLSKEDRDAAGGHMWSGGRLAAWTCA